MVPSDEELLAAVEQVLASEEDVEDDVERVANRVRDDHFMWKVSLDRVRDVIQGIKSQRKPPRKVPDELFTFDLASAQPGSIERRDWSRLTVDGVHHFQGGLGSTGCFLVKVDSVGFIILKQRSTETGNDLFATRMMQAIGVKAPLMRSLEASELEALTENLREARVSVKGTCDEIHGSRFQEAGAMIMELAKGNDMEAKPLSPQELRSTGRALRSLGAMIVMDTVINNPDRIPCVWRSEEGNPANVLVNQDSKNEQEVFVAIDQTVNPIKNEALLDQYRQRVSGLFESASVGRVRSFLGLGEEDIDVLELILAGANETIAFLKSRGEDLVRQVVQDVLQSEPGFQADLVQAFVVGNIEALPESQREAGSLLEMLQALWKSFIC